MEKNRLVKEHSKKHFYIAGHIVLIIVLVMSVLFMNVAVVRIINHAKSAMFAEFKQNVGFRIDYDRISPNILTSIDIYNVRLTNDQDMDIRLGNVELEYSLFRLLQLPGNPKGAFALIKALRLKDFQLDVTETELRTTVTRIMDYASSHKQESSGGFIDKIKDISLELPHGSIIIRNDKGALALTIRNCRSFYTDCLNIKSEIAAELSGIVSDKIRANLSLAGSVSNISSITTTDFRFMLNKAEMGAYGIRNFNMKFSSIGSDWVLQKMTDSNRLSITLAKQDDTLRMSADGQMSRDEIRRFISGGIPDDVLPENGMIQTRLTYSLSGDRRIDGQIHADISGIKSPDTGRMMSASLSANVDNSILQISESYISHDDTQDRMSISGTVPLWSDERQILFSASRFSIHGMLLDFDASLRQHGKDWILSSADIVCGGVSLGGFEYKLDTGSPSGIISLHTVLPLNGYHVSGSIVKDADNHISVYMRHNPQHLSLSKIIKALGRSDISFVNDMYLSGTIDTNIVGGVLTIPTSQAKLIKTGDKPGTPVSAVFSMNGKTLTVRKMDVLDGRVTLGGQLDFVSDGIRGDVMTVVTDRDGHKSSYRVYGSADSKNVRLNVGNALRGSYNIASGKLALNGNKFALPFGSRSIIVSCNVAADVAKRTLQDSDVTIENLTLFNGKIGTLKGRASFSDGALSLTKLQYIDGYNHLTGSLNGHFRNADILTQIVSGMIKPGAGVNIAELDLDSLGFDGSGFFTDDAKKESYSLEWTVADGNVESKIYLTNMALGKLGNPNLSGLLNARLHAFGKLTNPTVEVQGDIDKAKYGKSKLSGSFAVVKDANAVRIRRAIFSLGRHDCVISDSYLGLGSKSKNVSLNATLTLKKLAKAIKTDVRLSGSFEKFSGDTPFSFDAELKNVNLSYLRGGVPFEAEKFDGVKLALRRKDGRFTVTNYGQKFIDLTIDNVRHAVRGYIYADKSPILTCNINTANEHNLSGSVRLKQFPAKAAHRIIYPFVCVDGGLLDGQIDISGTAADPQFNGTASLYYGKIELRDYLSDPISNLTGLLVFADNHIYVNNVNGAVRKGLVHGNGEIVFNGKKFESFHFDVTSNTIPAKVVKGPVDAVGSGHIDSFVFDGRPGSYLFSGSIVLENAEVNLSNFGVLAKSKKKAPVIYPITVELNLITGDKVKVNYPIINVHLKSKQMLTMRYVGTEPAIYLGGEVKAEKGTLNYFNKEFKIEDAAFSFYEDEQKINPFVNLKSYYRTKDGKNNNVMVYLSINDRLASFKTTVSAMPYKTVGEINSILGTNFATNEEDERLASADTNYSYKPDLDTVANTTNYLSSSFMFSPVENTVKRMTGLDTFSLNTAIFGNMIKSNNNWLDLIDDTQLSFGKYLTNELYIGSVMSFQKLSNSGSLFIPFQDKNYGINLELLMSLELPYLSIGYKFLPKDYSNMLNANHQISVEANFKF